MPISSEYPLSIAETWAKAVQLWRKSFSRVWPLLILWVLVLFLPIFFVENEYFTLWPLLGYLGAYLLITLFFYAAVYHRLYFVLLNKKGGFFEALLFGLKKLPFLIIALIISTFLICLGLGIFVFPGLYLVVVFWFYFPLILFGNLGPFAAFSHSFELIKGYWWKTLIVVGLPALVFYLIAALINYFSFGFETQLPFPPVNPKRWFLDSLTKMIFGIIYTPFFAATVVIHWQNLKAHYKKRLAAELSETSVVT